MSRADNTIREPAPARTKNSSPTPTRRGTLLGALGLAGAVALPAISAPAIGRHLHHEDASAPDAALIAACDALCAIEREMHAEIDALPDDADGYDQVECAKRQQAPHLAVICGTAATTLAGIRAKARTVVLEDKTAIREAAFLVATSRYTNERLRASLLHDVLVGEGMA